MPTPLIPGPSRSQPTPATPNGHHLRLLVDGLDGSGKTTWSTPCWT